MNVFETKSLERLLSESEHGDHGVTLKRTLSATTLVALGIGAVIGAGIFTLTGVAAANHAGPALVYSFILAAIGCGFAAFCYSEFATMIPIAGSAYTYAYATLGEIIAWVIGWALILEYAIGAATVAVSWSATIASILKDFGVIIPPAIAGSPYDMNHPGALNLVAVFIVVAISAILIIGIRESARFNSFIVFVKVSVVILFILLGYFYINRANYHPFLPVNAGTFGKYGWSGVLAAAGQVFFAYIGFDAVSTAAQEAKNPKRDMPIGIIGSLAICTILYILYSLVLTGLVNYKALGVPDPLPVAVDQMRSYPWVGELMKVGSLLGLTSVILVMLLGQSRVFYSMSRDGLLPGLFSRIHPRFQTPYLSNVVLLIFVSLGAAFTPIEELGKLTSMGTLFAFIVVCAGIMVLRRTRPDLPRPFRTPWVPVIPILGILVNLGLMAGLDRTIWLAFFIWMALGLIVYLAYSRFHSHLQQRQPETARY